VCGADSAVRPTQPLSRPPTIQKLGAENHTLQLNIWCSWWWAYVPETCRAKYTLIKLPFCIKLAFHIISLVYFYWTTWCPCQKPSSTQYEAQVQQIHLCLFKGCLYARGDISFEQSWTKLGSERLFMSHRFPARWKS